MDLERLRLRAKIIQDIRAFFVSKGYLELDAPALAAELIPETCLEVFKTELIPPGNGPARPLYLTPSPEVYIKPLIAAHKVNVFQVSKCYRNGESIGRLHSPEFTMLEYYTLAASYRESALLTEELFRALAPPANLAPPFIRVTMDEAFDRWAGFPLSAAQDTETLARRALGLGLAEPPGKPFASWAWDDLYELILVQAVEPNLPTEKPILLMDYPAQVPCLAKDGPGNPPLWKERWELYAAGVELANCYSEETSPSRVRAYFDREGALKARNARVPHAINPDYWKIFADFPECSGVALGVDRLIALFAGAKTLESILPFRV